MEQGVIAGAAPGNRGWQLAECVRDFEGYREGTWGGQFWPQPAFSRR
jgi:hypothetical protein